MQGLYSDNGIVCIYCFWFQVMWYIIFYSFRCEIRVTLMLCSSFSSSILIFYLIYPHPLNSFINYSVIVDPWCSICVVYRIIKVVFFPGSLQWYQSWRLSITLALWRDSVEMGLVIPYTEFECIYMSAYFLVNIKWFYIVEIYWLSCLWVLVDQFDPLYR